jgi:hypothetical protein
MPNPNRSGNREGRNNYCPHYSACLSDAVEKKWPGFSCSGCEYRAVKSAPEDSVDGCFMLLVELFKGPKDKGPRCFRRPVP